MNKKDEALKLALEALKPLNYDQAFNDEIVAIREALAEQPAQQEPKPKFVRNVDGVPCITLVEHEHLMRSRSKPAQQQEHVTVHQFRKSGCSDWYDGIPDDRQRPWMYETRTLYTSPPASKPWVGLTDEEIEDAWPFVWRKHESVRHFAIYHAIEAKLKERNNG